MPVAQAQQAAARPATAPASLPLGILGGRYRGTPSPPAPPPPSRYFPLLSLPSLPKKEPPTHQGHVREEQRPHGLQLRHERHGALVSGRAELNAVLIPRGVQLRREGTNHRVYEDGVAAGMHAAMGASKMQGGWNHGKTCTAHVPARQDPSGR